MRKIVFAVFATLIVAGQSYSQIVKKENMKTTEQADHYTFQLSDKVTRKKVVYNLRGFVV